MSVADNIKAEEGWRAHVYPDSLGFATLGYGFLVDSRRGDGLPKAVAEYWLEHILQNNRFDLIARWQPFLSQPPEVQGALEEMVYQLGMEGFLGFHRMLAALQNGDRVTAAAELLDSQLHKQTPQRAERLASRLKGES